MNTTLLQDTFLYFAKYPAHLGVMKFFNKNSADPAYVALKESCQVLPVKDKFPEITDYIFGVNETSVKRKIESIKGIYLFVDYGNINSAEDIRNVKHDTFHMAVTVAQPTSSSSFDLAEELVISDKLLTIISSIRNEMRQDKEDPFVRRIIFPNDITPFFARELSNSYGWTLMFQLKGVDLV